MTGGPQRILRNFARTHLRVGIRPAGSLVPTNQKGPALQDLLNMELAGLEPATSWVRSRRSPN
jgi:hypothetical protein